MTALGVRLNSSKTRSCLNSFLVTKELTFDAENIKSLVAIRSKSSQIFLRFNLNKNLQLYQTMYHSRSAVKLFRTTFFITFLKRNKIIKLVAYIY